VLHDPALWIWDSWIADDGERYHLFFLKSPRAIGDPALRHTAASIGRATSTDLAHWDYEGEVLRPSPCGWDDLALWTGSVARGDDGVWRLYYTALHREGGVHDQRIGLAESGDLRTWRRVGDEPLLTADPRWYTGGRTWRDPFVFRDPGGDGWHMLITARAAGAPRRRDGVLAHARSADMRHWEIGPPACAPDRFGELEVPQVRRVGGRALLLFTCHPDEQERPAPYCTWTVAGDSPAGPWDLARARPYEADPDLFAAPLVPTRDGGWALLGFRTGGELEIRDPVRVIRAGDALVPE